MLVALVCTEVCVLCGGHGSGGSVVLGVGWWSRGVVAAGVVAVVVACMVAVSGMRLSHGCGR
jgi:hypothetical protein